jgi:hypothetical protein
MKTSMSTAQAIIFYILIVAVAAFSLIFDARHRWIVRKITKLTSIDAKLDLLLQNSGLKYEPLKNLPPGVAEAIAGGNKLQAIKLYRRATAVNLTEAKLFIEDLQRRAGT